MKKINWKEVWEESKKYGNIEGPEKWALYFVLFFVIFIYAGWWYENCSAKAKGRRFQQWVRDKLIED